MPQHWCLPSCSKNCALYHISLIPQWLTAFFNRQSTLCPSGSPRWPLCVGAILFWRNCLRRFSTSPPLNNCIWSNATRWPCYRRGSDNSVHFVSFGSRIALPSNACPNPYNALLLSRICQLLTVLICQGYTRKTWGQNGTSCLTFLLV
jgi:hypothetical protein